MATFLAIEYVQIVQAAKVSLRRRVAVAIQHTNTLLADAERILARLARDTDMSASAETIRLFARAQYIDPRWREIGLLDSDGRLVATNFGPVTPPLPVTANARSNPAVPGLQVLGLFETHVMGERSVIVSLMIDGRGELNVLVDPMVLLSFLGESDQDPDGFIAFVGRDDRVLAKLGRAPVYDDMLVMADDTDVVRVSRSTNRGDIKVVAEVTRHWVLRNWWRQVFVVAPVALLCNGLLIVLVLRRFRRVRLDHDLRGGLQRGEFCVHYQPIVELQSGHCIGAECLLRWNHPRHDVLRPAVFIAIAE